jgi:glycosyltransferase involved in cell wall biosynthesis
MSSATLPLLSVPDVVLLNLSGDASRRPGRWGGGNVRDAFTAWYGLLRMRPGRFRLAHVPIAQNTSGLLRDLLLILVLRCVRVPYVIHLHGGYFDRYFATAPFLVRSLAKRLLARAVAGVVLTEGLKKCLLPVLPAERLHVIGNGCASELSVHGRDVASRPFTFLHVTTLSSEKGTRLLIQAAAVMPEARFLLAGPGFKEARSWAKGLDNVSVQPPVTGDEKILLFSRADCFVLPTMYRYEGQPIALLEAMSAGLPIVTTRRAGIPETVPGARFVNEDDFEDLVRGMQAVAADPKLARELGARNLSEWESNFTEDHYVAAVVALWSSLTKK